MKTELFDYYLPEELIAQTPLEKRDESRLMCLDKETGAISHQHFYELPEFLKPGDCLILNNSRVLPARLLGRRLFMFDGARNLPRSCSPGSRRPDGQT